MENRQINVKNINMKNLFKNKIGAQGLTPFVMSLVATILFSLCIIGFAISFISTKNPTSPVLDPIYNLSTSYDDLNASASSFSDKANSIATQLNEAKAEPITFVFLMFQGAFLIPVSILSFVASGLVLLQTLLFGILTKNMGLPPIVGTVLIALFAGLLFTIVFLIIRAIRTGDAGN